MFAAGTPKHTTEPRKNSPQLQLKTQTNQALNILEMLASVRVVLIQLADSSCDTMMDKPGIRAFPRAFLP